MTRTQLMKSGGSGAPPGGWATDCRRVARQPRRPSSAATPILSATAPFDRSKPPSFVGLALERRAFALPRDMKKALLFALVAVTVACSDRAEQTGPSTFPPATSPSRVVLSGTVSAVETGSAIRNVRIQVVEGVNSGREMFSNDGNYQLADLGAGQAHAAVHDLGVPRPAADRTGSSELNARCPGSRTRKD